MPPYCCLSDLPTDHPQHNTTNYLNFPRLNKQAAVPLTSFVYRKLYKRWRKRCLLLPHRLLVAQRSQLGINDPFPIIIQEEALLGVQTVVREAEEAPGLTSHYLVSVRQAHSLGGRLPRSPAAPAPATPVTPPQPHGSPALLHSTPRITSPLLNLEYLLSSNTMCHLLFSSQPHTASTFLSLSLPLTLFPPSPYVSPAPLSSAPHLTLSSHQPHESLISLF